MAAEPPPPPPRSEMAVAQLAAFVGIAAGFWHITWIAGVAFLAAAVVAVGVHSAGFSRLERTNEPAGASRTPAGCSS